MTADEWLGGENRPPVLMSLRPGAPPPSVTAGAANMPPRPPAAAPKTVPQLTKVVGLNF